MLPLAWIEIASEGLFQATLARRLPALNQPQPKYLVTGVASGSGKATPFIGPPPEQVHSHLFPPLPTSFVFLQSGTQEL
jgi:hypothetical protein